MLSRILYARETPEGLRRLRETVASAIDGMIGELCRQAGIARDRVYELTVSGNTTMQQLLCEVDPSPLGEVPFVPTGGRGLTCMAAELGINVHPRAGAYVMPVIGGFVGGDTVAGILATGLRVAWRVGQTPPPLPFKDKQNPQAWPMLKRPRFWSTSARTARSCFLPTGSSWPHRPPRDRRSRAPGFPAECEAARSDRKDRGRGRPLADQRDRQRPADGPMRLGLD